MPQVQVQDNMTNTDGVNESGVSSTTQTMADPKTGSSTKSTSTRMWSGQNPTTQLVWLLCGIVVLFLAADFIFHAFGANNVGFASFVFAVGGFFAAPFAGIFSTSTAASGNLVIWADVLAITVYVVLAAIISKAITVVNSGHHAAGSV